VSEIAHNPPRRPWSAWIVASSGGALLLWLASSKVSLLPAAIPLPRPELLAAAIVLQAPYAALRALRLRFVLDPLVCRASDGRQRRLSPRLLYGSGWLSFLVVMLLPLRLGELSRPLLLARGGAPGVGLAEAAIAAVAERAIDGLMVVGLLLGGLALAAPVEGSAAAPVQALGQAMGAVFVAVLVALALVAAAPRSIARRVGLAGRWSALLVRLGAALRPLAAPARGIPFVAVTILYWAITALQLWLVLGAVGLGLGLAEAAVVVAAIGLSIQLPGGPAQVGSFQVGALAGLALFLDEGALAGPGSAFIALMYLLALGGALLQAILGALWLRRR